VLDAREVRPALTALAQDVMTVAAAEGVTPMGFNGYDPAAFRTGGPLPAIDASFDAMVAFNRRSAKTHTGVWRDIAVHHRQTEAEAQFAPIMALARRHGIAVPHLERLVSLIHEVESRARPQAWDNLARLMAPRGEHRSDAHPI
jgi:2-dehydropantoate 2-reductase